MKEEMSRNEFDIGSIRDELMRMTPDDEPLAFPCADDRQYSCCTTLANELNTRYGENMGKFIHVSRDYPDSLVFFVCVSWAKHIQELIKESPPFAWRENLRKKKRGSACPAYISFGYRRSLWRKRLLLCRGISRMS